MSDDPALTADQIIALYAGLTDAENHFNGVQAGYRQLASAWMLAAIGASGFLLFPSDGKTGVHFRLAGGMCLVSSLGTAILWQIDRTYQRLIGAQFNEGLALEEAFPWLPRVRHRIRAQFGGSLPRRVFVYYLSIASILWAVGGALVVFDLRNDDAAALGAAVFFFLAYLAGVIVAQRAESVALNLGGSPVTDAPVHADRVRAFQVAATGKPGSRPSG